MYGFVGLCMAMQGYKRLYRASKVMYGYVALCRAMWGYIGLSMAT